jgi:hypothetical protein
VTGLHCACRFLRKANWLLIWILNISIIIVWLFGQFGFGVYFSSQKLHNNIRSEHLAFAIYPDV